MRILGLILVLLTAGVSLAQQPTFQIVGTMSQLMIDIIYPTSNDIFYIERTPPSNDREWAAIERTALILAELQQKKLAATSCLREKSRWLRAPAAALGAQSVLRYTPADIRWYWRGV